MTNWIYPEFDFQPRRPLFMVVMSNTAVGKIPGLSAAGTTPDLTFYTPGADAELVETNRIMTMPELPETPGGSPTPAILTRAALTLAKIPSLFVSSGLEKKPAVPFVDLGGLPGRDIRESPAVPDASAIFERGVILGKKVSLLSDCVFIGETIAGGTTTALAVLKALGYDLNVSSSFATNPTELKENVAAEGLLRAGIGKGDLRTDPMRAIAEVGDPMMPAVLGLLRGLTTPAGPRIVLAGGTQMAAILAMAHSMGIDGDISIATTRYVAEDRSAHFIELVKSLNRPYYIADPGLERSKLPPVQTFAQGYVKEGVGAGGAVLAASLYGVSQQQIVEETDRVLMTVKLPHV
ncbi:MAG: hypothetical protein A4E47_00579 [Methanosaeta sp. PtaU1.Bin028]|nr:MAG: hypothetical protein A4E47_00579 [Methanosaeta sp. PtaU1.Bin028]